MNTGDIITFDGQRAAVIAYYEEDGYIKLNLQFEDYTDSWTFDSLEALNKHL